jgi:hypothetical protein
VAPRTASKAKARVKLSEPDKASPVEYSTEASGTAAGSAGTGPEAGTIADRWEAERRQWAELEVGMLRQREVDKLPLSAELLHQIILDLRGQIEDLKSDNTSIRYELTTSRARTRGVVKTLHRHLQTIQDANALDRRHVVTERSITCNKICSEEILIWQKED